MGYNYRPSVSPVVAGLFAAGVIKRRHRVLDVGCGTGTDCLAIMAWKLRSVTGIDDEEEAIDTAIRRARRYGLGSITELHECFIDRKFDVVIDSLCWNNIHVEHPHATPAYARQIFRVLEPGGLFILQARQQRHILQVDVNPYTSLPRVFRRYFKMRPLITSHLPEMPRRRGERGHALVAITIGRRRARPLR